MTEHIPSKTYDELAVEYITSGDAGAVNSVNARIAVRLFAVWLDKRTTPETGCAREALKPFVELFAKREAIYRKRGGYPESFPDEHPSFDIDARELPLGIWRKAQAAYNGPALSKADLCAVCEGVFIAHRHGALGHDWEPKALKANSPHNALGCPACDSSENGEGSQS
jgi:hypothetical protein